MLFRRCRHHILALAGAAALSVLPLASAPASAAMATCPAGTPAYFTGANVYLSQETPDQTLWSTHLTLTAYCGSVDATHALSGVLITGVTASLPPTGSPFNGVMIPDLKASADGSVPSVTLTTGGVSLPVPAGLKTGADGSVTLVLRASSASQPDLSGPGGAPQLIGMQMDYGAGTGTFNDPTGAPDPTQTFQFPIFGGGGIYAQTPELDSLLLFGSGATAMASYALMRMRGRRRS